MAETVAFLVRRGVPVMGHVGLTPQAVNTMGGFRVQGQERRGPEAPGGRRAGHLRRRAPSPSCWRASSSRSPARSPRSIAAPTIGIGASPACDGQILVLEDMLGLSDWTPKFVKKFGSLREHIEAAVSAYAEEVRAGTFPGPEQVYQSEAGLRFPVPPLQLPRGAKVGRVRAASPGVSPAHQSHQFPPLQRRQMAQDDRQSEQFIREVDEELRRAS